MLKSKTAYISRERKRRQFEKDLGGKLSVFQDR